jgi:hypothetical protein
VSSALSFIGGVYIGAGALLIEDSEIYWQIEANRRVVK